MKRPQRWEEELHKEVMGPDVPQEWLDDFPMSSVEERELEWIWPQRLAKGMITVLDGPGGVGKSQVTLDTISRITTGAEWPDYYAEAPGVHPRAPEGTILLIQEEDPLAQIVMPRLRRLGANLDRVRMGTDIRNAAGVTRQIELPKDIPYLVDWCRGEGHLGIFLDPLFDYVSADHSMNSDQEMRQALRGLRKGAEEVGFFVQFHRHVRKARAGAAADNGLGTVGITNLSRLNMLVGRHPDDEELFVIAPSKQNFTAPPKALVYRIVEFEEERELGQLHHTHVQWTGVSDLTAEDLVQHITNEERTLAREIAEMVVDMVQAGMDDYKQLQKIAQERGISDSTWHRAMKATGLPCRYDRMNKRWRITPQ